MMIPNLLEQNNYDVKKADKMTEAEMKDNGMYEQGASILTKMGKLPDFATNELQLRGGKGEYTPPGPGGAVDVSYKKRTYVTEAQIIGKLIFGMKTVRKLEEDAKAALAKSTTNLRKGHSQQKLQS